MRLNYPKIKHTAFLIVSLALFNSPNLQADIFVILNQGNTIIPLEDTQISMDSEVVEVTPNKYGQLQVNCTFMMTSHASKQVQRIVAFPVVSSRYGKYMKKHFRVDVDGTSQPVTLKMADSKDDWSSEFYHNPDHKAHQYPGAVHWPVTWNPGQTRKIVCSYQAGRMEYISGLSYGRRFHYVVRTGNYWKGPIGKAKITVRFSSDPRFYLDKANPDSVVLTTTFPKHAKWISDKEVCWTFSDWIPKSDIVVQMLKWRGLPGSNEIYTAFKLPKDYSAGKLAYTDESINSLAKSEIEECKKLFPKEIEKLDKVQLKIAIANILYHEIYARHNYAFVMGKYTGMPGREPGGVSIAPDKTVFGRWYGYFIPYLLHGGWYKPDRNLSLEEVKTKLNKHELANLAFLKQQGAKEDKFTFPNVLKLNTKPKEKVQQKNPPDKK